MKKIFYFCSFLLFCLSACNSNKNETPPAENDVDAIRNFIQLSLYGDYDKAQKYMLADSTNIGLLNAYRRVSISPNEKSGLATASINIHNVNRVNDSVTVVIYSNSFKNNWDTLKAINHNGEWLVDFKYLFNHDQDTLIKNTINKTDSIQ